MVRQTWEWFQHQPYSRVAGGWSMPASISGSAVGVEFRVEPPSEVGDRVEGTRGPAARRDLLFPTSPYGLRLLGVCGLDGLHYARAAQAFGLRGLGGLTRVVLGLIGSLLLGLDLFLGALSFSPVDLFAKQPPSAGERHGFHPGEQVDQSAPRGLAAAAQQEHEDHQDQE